MARIVEHLPAEELEARYRAARDATEARHYQAIWLLAQGRTVLEVAEVLAFVPRWVEELAARYNAFGPEALGDQRRRNGRTASLLTPDLLAALAERLREPPEDGGLWSGPKVAAWMARHLGLAKVHPAARLGGAEAAGVVGPDTAAAPSARGDARGPGGAEKKLDDGGRASGGRASGPAGRGLGRGRAPSGPEAGPAPGLGAGGRAAGRARPPPLPVAPCRRLRAADQRRGGLVSLQRPLEAFLRRTARHLRARDRRGPRRSIVLVLDNAGWHGPEDLAVPDGISLVFLPPYSPELQPAERLWSLVDEPIVNRHVASLDELTTIIAERCRRLDAATLEPHTNFHWWPKPTKPN